MTEIMTDLVKCIGLIPTIILFMIIDFYLVYKMFDWLGIIDHFSDDENED